MNYRIAVVGTAGAGKTTLAQAIAETLQIPHIELDALFWQPDWQPSETGEFWAKVAAATAGEDWIVDGNYLRARLIVWERATVVVWLNYSLPLILWRVVRRTVVRSWRQQELWNGCYETFQKGFWSRDSIILWVLKTYHQNRRSLPDWLAMPQYQHLQLVELRSPAEAESWLRSLPAGIATDAPEAVAGDQDN
jgi:adenylate kinase family enzyme